MSPLSSSLRLRLFLPLVLLVLPGLVAAVAAGAAGGVDLGLGVSIALMIAAVALAWVVTDLAIVRRVRALVSVTRRLGAGDLSARVGPAGSVGELRELAAAIDTLASALQQREAEADRRARALVAQERRFRALIENSPDGVVLVSREGTLLYSSPSTERIVGYRPEDIVGRDASEIVHPDDVARVLANRAAVLRVPGGVIAETFRIRRKDGAWRWIRAVVRNLLDEPAVGAIVGNYQDVTEQTEADAALRRAHEELERRVEERTAELLAANRALEDEVADRRRAEESLRKLSRVVEQTGDSVFVTDRAGVIEYVNPSFEELTGYSHEEALGATPKLFGSGMHDRQFFSRLWRTLLAGHSFRSVFVNRKKNGRLYHEDQTVSPIRNSAGEITHFVSTGRDITQRRRAEEALRRLNERLEQETTRIAGLIHDEAGQFLTAAHITLSEVSRETPQPLRERLLVVKRNLDQIEEQVRRLSHELHPRVLDDLGLVAAVGFLAEGVGKRTGVGIRVSAPPELRCPPEVQRAVYRLVQEALTNLARHSGASAASVALELEEHCLRCSVRDDGVGFEVAKVLSRPRGLGLDGIRDRLEAVGGVLEIDAWPGRGTELRATIPLDGTGASRDHPPRFQAGETASPEASGNAG